MRIEDILIEWEKDCKIDPSNLEIASFQTPDLHAKYLSLLSTCRLKLKDCEFKQKVLLKDKWLHYNGKMSEKQIKDRGWLDDPLDGLRVLKGDMDYFYESDEEIIKSEQKVVYYQELCDVLKEILEHVKWRHQTIGNIIRNKQFESGF